MEVVNQCKMPLARKEINLLNYFIEDMEDINVLLHRHTELDHNILGIALHLSNCTFQ
jgi:hypothetical protein